MRSRSSTSSASGGPISVRPGLGTTCATSNSAAALAAMRAASGTALSARLDPSTGTSSRRYRPTNVCVATGACTMSTDPRVWSRSVPSERPFRRLGRVAAAQNHEVHLVAFRPETDCISGSALDDNCGDGHIGTTLTYEVFDVLARLAAPDVPLKRISRHVACGPAFQDANDRDASTEGTCDGQRVRHDELAHCRSIDAGGYMAKDQIGPSGGRHGVKRRSIHDVLRQCS
jgi:hypothetical protein